MTIAEAIEQCDSMKPNHYEASAKIRWLSILDGTIKNEIIDSHEGYELIPFVGYDSTTSLETVLLVPEPYSDVYLNWLFAQIDYNNAEFTRYNNSLIMYNVTYQTYAQYYNRKNLPLQLNTVRLEPKITTVSIPELDL